MNTPCTCFKFLLFLYSDTIIVAYLPTNYSTRPGPFNEHIEFERIQSLLNCSIFTLVQPQTCEFQFKTQQHITTSYCTSGVSSIVISLLGDFFNGPSSFVFNTSTEQRTEGPIISSPLKTPDQFRRIRWEWISTVVILFPREA